MHIIILEIYSRIKQSILLSLQMFWYLRLIEFADFMIFIFYYINFKLNLNNSSENLWKRINSLNQKQFTGWKSKVAKNVR